MGKRSKHSVDERRAGVLSVLRREEPLCIVARRYGVSEPTMSKWRISSQQAQTP